jgi:hypothetical protein
MPPRCLEIAVTNGVGLLKTDWITVFRVSRETQFEMLSLASFPMFGSLCNEFGRVCIEKFRGRNITLGGFWQLEHPENNTVLPLLNLLCCLLAICFGEDSMPGCDDSLL